MDKYEVGIAYNRLAVAISNKLGKGNPELAVKYYEAVWDCLNIIRQLHELNGAAYREALRDFYGSLENLL